jgi:polysaccharide pyruvyl transferase WcaK-like protein
MMIAEQESTSEFIKPDRQAPDMTWRRYQTSRQGPRVVLLTPYTGANLGDAAIQDAMIANLRERLPDAQFSGISLNCDNFVERHGMDAFPVCVSDRPFYGMSRGREGNQRKQEERFTPGSNQKKLNLRAIRMALRRAPALRRRLKAIHAWGASLSREFRHWVEGYRFLRRQDILIVSGGGQLDEEWGGPWGHPFALFKWAILARVAGIPCAVASVGACKATSRTTRGFLSATLRLSRYRSYRDKNSKEIAAGLVRIAAKDSVVPDLAFSIPPSELPRPAGIRSISQGRPTIAISLMAFAKPGSWPYGNLPLYDRYVQQMARVVSQLIERGYFLVIVSSSLGADKRVILDLLNRLQDDSKKKLALQMHIPEIANWKDLVASLLDVDFLVASRLHSAILGFATQTPTIAISFDPKVDWVMEDLDQTDYLLQIRDFSAEDVIEALDRIKLCRNVVVDQIASYRQRILSALELQYDALAKLALATVGNGSNE